MRVFVIGEIVGRSDYISRLFGTGSGDEGEGWIKLLSESLRNRYDTFKIYATKLHTLEY